MRITSHQVENINVERETSEKNQIEILELKYNNWSKKITSPESNINIVIYYSIILQRLYLLHIADSTLRLSQTTLSYGTKIFYLILYGLERLKSRKSLSKMVKTQIF